MSLTPLRRFGIPLLLVALASHPCWAQMGSVRTTVPPGSTSTVKVYRLHYAQPPDLMSVLRGLFSDITVTFDLRTNSILVHALPERQGQVQTLIEQLDRAVEKEQSGRVTRIVPLENRKARDLEDIVGVQLHRGSDCRWAVDSRTNSFVISGDSNLVGRLANLLAELDRGDPLPVLLEMWILSADEKGMPMAQAQLGPAAAELQRLGLADYRVISRPAVKVIEGETFKLIQQFQSGLLSYLSLQGSVELASGRKTAIVGLDTNLTIGGEKEGEVNYRTTVLTPLGEQLVIGLAPTGDASGRPLALVLRVTR